MSIFGAMKAVADTLADKASEAKAAGAQAVRSMLEEINGALKDLEKVGYYATDIEVAIGLPPSLTVFLEKRADAGDEAFAALAASYQGRKTASTLISMVRQADGWAESLRWSDRSCRMIAVELGLRPAVRLMYGARKDPAPAEAAEASPAL